MATPNNSMKDKIYMVTGATSGIGEVTGKYFVKEKEAQSSPASHDRAAAARLWQVSESLAGL